MFPWTRAFPLWLEHAAPNDDVAREGRAAMPFTVEQIEALGRLLRETQGAASRAADPPPEGRIRRVRIGSPGEGAIPAIAVRKGYVTAVSFTDVTGAPWPIEEVLVDGRFLPEAVLHEAAGDEDGRRGVATSSIWRRSAQLAARQCGVIKLRGLAEPLVASLRGGGAAADFRVEVRLGMPGPNAAAQRLQPGPASMPGIAVLLDLLGGIAPPGAEHLMVEGGGRDDRAWRLGGDLLLATSARTCCRRGRGRRSAVPAGRWAYRLPDVPYVLVSRDGREARLAFRAQDEVLAYQGVPLFPGRSPENGDRRRPR